MNEPSFQIVMATYNGANYVDLQIRSIVEQLAGGELLIHDDGSSDSTRLIIQEWTRRDSRIKVLEDPAQGGASANFSYLLEKITAPYVFCADQDDIWIPGRVERMLRLIKFYEGVYGEDKPLLVHGDLTLIDEHGTVIAESMWTYQKLDPRWGDTFSLLLTQNVVTGCAMVVNRALLDRALPVPKEASMHDHWLALVACGQGKVVWDSQPVLLYRQHGKNEVGAKAYNTALILDRLKKLFESSDRTREIKAENKLYDMGLHYAKRYPNRPESKQAIKFAQLKDTSLLLRPWVIFREKFFTKGIFRNLGWAIKPFRYAEAARRAFARVTR